MKSLLLFFFLLGCTTPMPKRVSIKEFIIDGEVGLLIGPEEKDDINIASCIRPLGKGAVPEDAHICYALLKDDYKKLLEYVVELEERLHSFGATGY